MWRVVVCVGLLVVVIVLDMLVPVRVSQVAGVLERDVVCGVARETGWAREVRTDVGTRCDLVSDTFAIEVDRPSKWKEALGQSLHYGALLRLSPGIMWMVDPDDVESRAFVLARVGPVAREHCVQMWWVDPESFTFEAIDVGVPELAGVPALD